MNEREKVVLFAPSQIQYSSPLNKLSAILEIVGVLVGGSLAAGALGSWLGLEPLGSIIRSGIHQANPDYMTLSVAAMKGIGLNYACLLLPAFAIGWWRRRLPLKNYGVTRAGNRLWSLIAIAGLCFAVVAMPVQLLSPLRPLHTVLAAKSWTLSFWVFMAVVSCVVLPIFEELFYRGYCQTRLEEAFGGVGACVIVALFTTLAHDQYRHLDAISIGTMLAIIPITLGFGYLYWRTRSLIPAMILHMAINIPAKGAGNFLLPSLMLIAIVLFRRRLTDLLRDFFRAWTERGWKSAAFLGAGLAIIVLIGFERTPSIFGPLALLGLGAAMVFELWQRQRIRSVASQT